MNLIASISAILFPLLLQFLQTSHNLPDAQDGGEEEGAQDWSTEMRATTEDERGQNSKRQRQLGQNFYPVPRLEIMSDEEIGKSDR
ncbi:hypothetical protein EXN66_Car001862 [Channa argus]|uniref:Uncharacterized protein n=1 Tax=Channa argus TaxID=215402 RepID=A0A6G1P7B4_CHAAH|nr:hypothetical protein EXN66_Car001862 [Channa argus]